jgi:hypothetical protein
MRLRDICLLQPFSIAFTSLSASFPLSFSSLKFDQKHRRKDKKIDLSHPFPWAFQGFGYLPFSIPGSRDATG